MSSCLLKRDAPVGAGTTCYALVIAKEATFLNSGRVGKSKCLDSFTTSERKTPIRRTPAIVVTATNFRTKDYDC